MPAADLLVFDFDGVIVDGMQEYWWSARRALLTLQPQASLQESVPEAFRQLRPWIHHGWEMVLMAALLSEADGPLQQRGVMAFVGDYNRQCKAALVRFGWEPSLLQATLEAVRSDAVEADRDGWLALHQPYPDVPDRLKALAEEGIAWSVLTTKGKAFTAELLAAMGLVPARLDGHESGPKPEVLLRLAEQWHLRGFVEDRRPTLEIVRATAGLAALPCWLVSWGYLQPADSQQLPSGIRLLSRDRFASPLAEWP